MDKITQLQDQVDKLQAQVDLLKSSATFPYDVENAIKDRISTNVFDQSTKTAASETQAVNEGGLATYSVAKPMGGFDQRLVDGVVRYYPYYL